MTQILLIVHLVITVVMIGLILLQRSEGGGLGIGGGGGGMGAFAGPRATANILTRATMTCFALFVGLSLLLAILAGGHSKTSVLDQLNQTPAAAQGPVIAPPVDEGDTIGEPSRTIEKPIVPVDQ